MNVNGSRNKYVSQNFLHFTATSEPPMQDVCVGGTKVAPRAEILVLSGSRQSPGLRPSGKLQSRQLTPGLKTADIEAGTLGSKQNSQFRGLIVHADVFGYPDGHCCPRVDSCLPLSLHPLVAARVLGPSCPPSLSHSCSNTLVITQATRACRSVPSK